MRDSVYVRIDSVNILYLIIDNRVDGKPIVLDY